MRYVLACTLLVVVAASMRADARAQSELPYTLSETFSTALRFVAVDRGCKIVDKDADAAFVSFECTDDGRVKRGSIELIKVQNGVRSQVTLGDDTHGMELRWLELFERKLRDERGTPTPPPPPAAPPSPKKDAGV